MNAMKKYISPLIILAIVTTLSSCSSNPTSNNVANQTPGTPSNDSIQSSSPSPSPTPTETPTPETTDTPLSTPTPNEETPTPSTTETPSSNKTVKVNVYTIDNQCQDLVANKVSVSEQEPVTAAVGKILKQQDTADFSISGYRVNVKDNVATVDLRRSADSKRVFSSLSSCEQRALFGSIEKTLISNSQWNIKSVRFTEKGKEIVE